MVETGFYIDSSLRMNAYPATDATRNADVTKRSWYIDALASKGSTIISEPTPKVNTKGESIMTAAKMSVDGSFTVGAIINIGSLWEELSRVKIGENGYVFVLDKNQKYLLHPTISPGEENTSSYLPEVYSKESGQISYAVDGVEKKARFITNPETGWKIIAEIDPMEIKDSASQILYTAVFLILGVAVVGAVVIYYLLKSIYTPLRRVVSSVSKVAEGDLRDEIDVITNDELGDMTLAVNAMTNNLRNLVHNLSDASQNLASSSEEISATTEEVASSSASQASATHSMQKLFEEFSEAIDAVAAGAEEAVSIAANTVSVAKAGEKLVEETIDGMSVVNAQVSRLEEDSARIGDIIEVISNIADQTNLLSLNAAIEAARAGDQGKGFAVVASEVRKLAERSTEATRQITSIIKQMQDNMSLSVTSVLAGTEKTKNMGVGFTQIISLIQQTESKVSEIAAACEEQAAQTTEITKSISSISEASLSSASAAQETAATSQALAVLAEDLNNSISRFKTN
ncbi:methyl-accepting chemotaxis protein TlpB [Paenibacillus curdlanolyticus]|nr:methyl-accepting chemotaxis protein TlpB [Paenibacillus curdlanolyticus]